MKLWRVRLDDDSGTYAATRVSQWVAAESASEAIHLVIELGPLPKDMDTSRAYWSAVERGEMALDDIGDGPYVVARQEIG